jgi:arylsulfatase A-like enzyme
MKLTKNLQIAILFLILDSIGRLALAGENRPNIVFILADDMGYGDVACQNPESKIPTPNLDRLATQGIRFTDAHSPSAVCSPTRYGILTGRYAWRTQLQKSVLWPWDSPLIEEDRLTVGDLLQEAGYDTACIGKWHLGWEWLTTDGSRYNDINPLGHANKDASLAFSKKVDFSKPIGGGPITRGFEYYFGDDVPNFTPYCFIENDRLLGNPTAHYDGSPFGWAGPMVEGWKFEAVMPALTERAVEYIKAKPGQSPFSRNEDKPFFLYFPLTAPHTPIAPADEFIGKSQAGRYGDFVFEVDWTVGQVMKALEETGQAENTLLIFTSDNGSPARDGTDMNGAPRSVCQYGHNPSYIFRGIKADIWEGGHRVPFIARWPGKVPSDATNEETICSIDLMATCAALIDKELPKDAGGDSCDILPALLGKRSESPLREATIHHSIQGMFAIRQGKWKLILGKGSGGWSEKGEEGDPPVQLYDMEADVGETNNLHAEYPEVVARLTALLEGVKSR